MSFEKASIGLPVLEVSFTMLKTDEIRNKFKVTALSAFITEEAIGVALAVNAVLALQGRKTVISSYPTVATVLVISYEVSVVLAELLLFIPHFRDGMHESDGNESRDSEVEIGQHLGSGSFDIAEERNGKHLESVGLEDGIHESIGNQTRDSEVQIDQQMGNVEEERIDQHLDSGGLDSGKHESNSNETSASETNLDTLVPQFVVSIFGWALICMGIIIYIVIARRHLPREGDFGVELTTLIAFGVAELSLFSPLVFSTLGSGESVERSFFAVKRTF